jgi:hypothetical protein
MKKKVAIGVLFLFAACIIATVACASSINLEQAKKRAQKFLPPSVEYLYAETESDEFELHYKDASEPIVYTVEVSRYSDTVTEIKTRWTNELGSTEILLDEEAVKMLIIEKYPDAVIRSVKLDHEKGLSKYEVKFYAGKNTENHGEADINPETGAFIKLQMKYLEKKK